MKNTDITDALFLLAVEAIDAGDISELETLINEHPRLVQERLTFNLKGYAYFKGPYLLWFVANNPIRTDNLPPNIVNVTALLIKEVKRLAPETFTDQINYTLGLVATGLIPRQSGVQLAMIDLLIEAGAAPLGSMGALAEGNIDAARHLIVRGDKLTLAAAVCLEQMDDVNHLIEKATPAEKLTALTAAAYYGKTDMVKLLITKGAGVNGFPDKNSGFHAHGTPLHQAVASGSLDTVKLLTAAGARFDIKDEVYDGTPWEWAGHLHSNEDDESRKAVYGRIEAYLLEKGK